MDLKKQYLEKFLIVIMSIAYFAVAGFLTEFFASNITRHYMDNEREIVHQNIALVRANFESAVFRDIHLADSLAGVVTIDPVMALKNWDRLVAKILPKGRFIKSVAISPDDVLTKVYPLKGNEKAVGLDLKKNPENYETVLAARELQDVLISPPIYLAQGGMGMIARYPIFLDYPENKEYWGGVSVVLDYMKLLEKTGIIGFQGAELALRVDPHAESGDIDPTILWGKVTVFDQPDLEYPITLPNNHWTIGAKIRWVRDFHSRNLLLMMRGIGLATSLILFGFIILLYREYHYMRRVSLYDELTQLPNRWLFFKTIERLLSSVYAGSSFALLNIDLNDFKRVNDTWGHQAGDELLKHVANRLVHALRSSDLVARIGGDEFVVILHRISRRPQLENIEFKIRRCVEKSPLIWKGTEIYPSLSIGAVLYTGQDTSVKVLMAEADVDMYRNKRAR